MENEENHFDKTSREAIKSLVPRAVPGNKNKQTKYAFSVFEG